MASDVPSEQGTQEETNLSSKIEAQRDKLQDIIAPGFGLTVKLYSCKVLTSQEKSLIDAKETTFDKNKLLLDFVLKSGKCDEFVQALRESGQTHVANWIEANGVYAPEFHKDWPLREKELEFLRCNFEHLSDMLDTEHEFLGRLLSVKVINMRQKEYISKKSTSYDCNEAFLEILKQSSVEAYNLTIICLRESNQKPVAKLFEEGGALLPIHATLEGDSVDEAEELIVSEMKKLCLENKPLLEGIDEDRLLARLRPMIIAVKKGKSVVLFLSCCTVQEFQHVCTMVDNDEMKKILEKLFSLLLRNLQTKVLLVTIYKHDRENAEKLFERQSISDKTHDEHFQRLRSQVKYLEHLELKTGESVEESEGKKLSQESEDPSTSAAAKEQETLKLATEESDEQMDEELQKKSDPYSTFGESEHFQGLLSLEASLSTDLYSTSASPEGVQKKPEHRPSTFLESEHFQGLLSLEGTLEEKDEELQKKPDLYSRSASPEGQSLRKTAQQLLDELPGIFYKTEADELRKGSDLPGTSLPLGDELRARWYLRKARQMRGNQEYLVERVKTHKTISKLTSLAIQTDRSKGLTEMLEHYERLSMRAPEIMSDVNRQLLIFILTSSDKVYYKFINCLRETGQGVVANVAEKGGATAKIKIILEPMENIADIEKEIVAKLNKLHETNSPKSEDLWHLLSQLKIGGIEMLGARYDEGIVAWIWCRSSNASAKLEKISEDKRLGNLFSALFRCLLIQTVPKINNVIWMNPFVDVAIRELCKWTVKTSATMTGLKISGIAMMGNRIIAVFQNRSSLLMFSCDELGNTVPQKEESLKHIDTPMHMAASTNLQCLYITDSTSNNIYKVNIDFDGKVDEPILLVDDFSADQINSLSVGRDDNLLVLKDGKPSRLEIYSKDGKYVDVLKLPDQIRYPHNVAEASNGDFVISYRSDLTPGGICRITRSGDWVSRLDLGFKSRQIQGLSKKERDTLLSLSEGNPYLRHLDHFTLDDDDQVYACDADQYVVFLDSELNMEGTVEVKDLKNPYRIHYLKDTKELLVVHGADQDSFSILCSK